MISEIGERVTALRVRGLSVKTIQKQLGCSRSTVSKWCALVRNNDEVTAVNLLAKTQLDVRSDTNRLRTLREKKLLTQLSQGGSYNTRYNTCRRESYRAWLMSTTGMGCQVCGYDRLLDNLVHHHLRDKLFDLSGNNLLYRLESLIEEAAKCIVLCCRCHGEVHAGLLTTTATPLAPTQPPDSIFEWYRDWLREKRPMWLASSRFAKIVQV